MSSKRFLILLPLIFVLAVYTSCRKEDDVPSPTPTADTAVPTAPTIAPTPTPAGLGLVPMGDDTAVPPQLIGQNPAAGEEAALDGALELYFDQPMDEAATTGALQITAPDGQPVDGEISWPQPRILRFKPTRALKSNSSYQATLSDTAVSASGAPLLEGLTITFNTIGDLAVSQTSPAPDAEEVAIDSAITVIFNRPVVPLMIAEDQANLPNPLVIKPDVSGQGEWINTSVFVFRPDAALIGRQTYTARVAADMVNDASASGAVMSDDYEWSFTVTAPTIRYFSLVDVTDSPHDGYENLRLDQPFQLFFAQAMDENSTETAVTLTPDNGQSAALDFSWDETRTTLTFTPTQLLELDAAYTLQVADSAQSAQGGRLREGLTWHATTVKNPAIRSTDPANGITQDRYGSAFTIYFASSMALDSLKGQVIISPAISGDTNGMYDRWDWSLHFYGLAPSTTYTVQIQPGMSDPYGNEISEGQTITFTTAPYTPIASFNFPGQMALYRPGGTTAVWVNYRNVNQLDVDLYRISARQFGQLMQGSVVDVDFTPGDNSLVWSQSPSVSAGLNARGYERFDLLAAGGQSLEPGFYFITLDSPQVEHDRRHLQAQPLLIATANLTLKTTATEAMIWLTDLNSGQPLASVPVAFYDENFNLIFRDTTDGDGLIYRDDLTLETGYRTTYYAITETGDRFGMAISGWNEGVRPYDFGISTDYYLQPGQPTAYIYTDRPIYRPGQPVAIKGIVRLNDDLDYSLPQYQNVDVTIHSYDETVLEETLPLSEFGSFDAELTLDEEATLGSYYIEVNAGNEWLGSGHFDVAEYRKPTFQVNVTAAAPDVLAGDVIDLTVDAQFFSGGSVVDGTVAWSVYASDYVFSAGGRLNRFSFYNDERDTGYYDGTYNPSTFIASGTGQTDGNGRFTVPIPAELSEESGSRQFTIEATVTDIAENAVSGRTNVIVHRSLVYPGIRSGQYVGQAEKEMTFDVALVDWDENPVPNQPVQIEIVERRWYSVQEENDQGETIWRSTVEEIPVYETDLTVDGRGQGTAVFTPEKGGVYRAYVTARDSQGNTAVSSTYVWVSGSDYVPWRRLNDNSFELIADADSYHPGDTAEILIASPFQGDATALVTVERGHIKEYETIRLTDNSTIYRLPITGEMAPNVFVSVMVVKGVDELNPSPDFKVGMTQFTVEREEQELTVEIVPDKTEAGPGDEVTYTVRVSDYNGRPVDAEVSLALADLAALTIAEPNARPILDFFYSERALSVNTALLLTRLMDAFNQELEDQIKGGGGGDGEMGIMTIRENFPDTAYWEGQLQTGPDGEASVTVMLPDNLTTWRMDARAVTLDTKVGQATADIVTTRPLLVNPNTPRFFVQGDTAVLSAAIHNNTDAELEATVTLQAEGVRLNDPATQLVTIPARQQARVTWETVVGDVDRVDLVFSAESGPYADATRPTLGTLEGQGIPVYKYEVPETVGTSGQLTEGGAVVESIALPIFPDFELTEGEVTVEVAPSLAAAMTDGLTYLEHYPYECTEQIVSRFLPNVLTSRALKAAGLSDPALEANLDEQVNVALQRLYSRQHADGGWPWWDGPNSSTLVTAYVVQALLEARDSGYLVSDGVIDQGVSYLQEHLREVDGLNGRFKLNRQSFLVYVLARAGEPDAGEMTKLYDQREALDWYARGYLAQAIQLNDPEDPRLETITADFITAAIISATGTNWEEAERDYWNWNSDTRTTAIVLDTMIKLDGENPLVANAVRWLMAHRVNGRWASTQETAWTLIALTDWMVASGELEADYQYEIALNGQLRGSGEANAATLRDSWQLQFDITELFTDQLNRLAIGRSDGPGNLYYTAHLQASLPVEQVQALDRGIIISRSYYDPADRETPITEIEQGQTFLARLTVVIPNSLHYVVIEDFLPAGLGAVDTSLKTSQQVSAPQRYDWDDYFAQGWGWWYFDHVELRDEKVVLSANYLPQGTYEYVYLVRASMPGEYQVIPPTAQEFYFPEVYGRGDGSLFVVLPQL
ncbi:MAG: Ig-like domain-containing protein [Ardenticatenaceae bacterium]|nr:Ig-like domain-containing protein [Ardenticatenaceae bacterium]MCB9443559.1 Ig-like domain-containing protein [Ardenticatenaceae bacterium]